MKLIGFAFLKTQEEFEAWQIKNGDFSVCSVVPHVREMELNNSEKYELHHDAKTVWGVFVVYSYEKDTLA